MRLRKTRANVIGIFSGKGGVGKTTIAVNLGLALSRKIKGKVLIVETNLLTSNLSLRLGFLENSPTIHDVIFGEANIEDAVKAYEEGFHVLPGSASFTGNLAMVDFRDLLEPLRTEYKIILLDSDPGFGLGIKAGLEASDETLLVCQPEVPAVAGAFQIFKKAKKVKTPVTGVVLNKVSDEEYEVSVEEVKRAFGRRPISVIPCDEAIPESVSQGVPFIFGNPDSPATEEFRRLARVLHDQDKSRRRVK